MSSKKTSARVETMMFNTDHCPVRIRRSARSAQAQAEAGKAGRAASTEFPEAGLEANEFHSRNRGCLGSMLVCRGVFPSRAFVEAGHGRSLVTEHW